MGGGGGGATYRCYYLIIISYRFGSRQRYQGFRRTLCPQLTDSDSEHSNGIVVDVSTSSQTNVTFFINVFIEADFNVGYVRLG